MTVEEHLQQFELRDHPWNVIDFDMTSKEFEKALYIIFSEI